MERRFGMYLRRTVSAVCFLLMSQSPSMVFAQSDSQQPVQLLSPNQLDSLVAPIALYPDALMSQILVAATYPLEVVEAWQWLQRNPGLTGGVLTDAAGRQNWDPSIQALVMFPDVLKRLSEDVAWTTGLGNAFLDQEGDVMNAIQRMRVTAQQAGQLYSTPQQQVITTVDARQSVVEIVPASSEIIYVPVYDPVWIWGPVSYYPYPRWYYPQSRAIFFDAGTPVANYLGRGWNGWNSWGWRPSWRARTIVINNTFIQGHNFNVTRPTNLSGTTVWTHDGFHRRGIPYPRPARNQTFQTDVRQNLRARPDPASAPVQPQPGMVVPPRPSQPLAVGERRREQAGARPIAPDAFQNDDRRSARPRPGPAPTPAPAQPAFVAPARPAQPFAVTERPREEAGARTVAPDVHNRNSAFPGENANSARRHEEHRDTSPAPAKTDSPPSAPGTPAPREGAPSRNGQNRNANRER